MYGMFDTWDCEYIGIRFMDRNAIAKLYAPPSPPTRYPPPSTPAPLVLRYNAKKTSQNPSMPTVY